MVRRGSGVRVPASASLENRVDMRFSTFPGDLGTLRSGGRRSPAELPPADTSAGGPVFRSYTLAPLANGAHMQNAFSAAQPMTEGPKPRGTRRCASAAVVIIALLSTFAANARAASVERIKISFTGSAPAMLLGRSHRGR
jgi:hypothetical protein